MSSICNGCGKAFKKRGLESHRRLSGNPYCAAGYQKQDDLSDYEGSDPLISSNIILSDSEESDNEYEDPIIVDPHGDIFGSYTDCSSMDLEINTERNEDLSSNSSDTFNSDDEDETLQMKGEDEICAAEEHCFEPEWDLLPMATESWNNTNNEQIPVPPEARLCGGYKKELKNIPFVCKFGQHAGEVLQRNQTDGQNEEYLMNSDDVENPYTPFSSKLEWEIAKWAKLQLIKIDGVVENWLNKLIDECLPGHPPFVRCEVMVGGEVCEVYFRDILACVKALFRNPEFAPYLVFAPEKHYTDETKTVQSYHDMHTGKWWWALQTSLEKSKPGATIVPIIISTDKTQLTLFQNKSAYPIYLTIGNIPKEIPCKPSAHAYVLLGYLPTTQLENITNNASRRRQLANLYHACMHQVLKPIIPAGIDGVFMATATGDIHRNHPVFATFIGDYPEQVLTTCTQTGDCATCPTKNKKLVNALSSFDADPAGFLQVCKEAGIKPVAEPFWKNLPYVNIYQSITPDVLHQLYQGIIKHLVSWIIAACGSAEINACCQWLPPNHNICLFMKGISSLSHVTGQEHSQMACILLGLVIDIPLPNSLSSTHLICAVQAILDFLFLAQYPIHTDNSLLLLDHALNNFNTEYTERLHIDLAKNAYRATNHKDEFAQMTTWLSRKEKIHHHEQYITWWLTGCPQVDKKNMATSCCHAVTIDKITQEYGAQFFRDALARFVTITNNPGLDSIAQLEHDLWDVHLPTQKFQIWHYIKFTCKEPFSNQIYTADSIHARPQYINKKHEVIPGHFDTAYINDGTGINTGTDEILGYRIGQVRLIFSLTETTRSYLFTSTAEVPEHLAYIEWFTKFSHEPDPKHLLYKITPAKDRSGGPLCSIISVANICRSAHLFPKFGPVAPEGWTSSNVLDKCNVFYVNSFTDAHLYRIMV
ncbi:hypothetical protein BDQ17DRAFT_1391519 [Cyathus striatus]|nr:hypothetical protein BDQ17DRAFT_1391519 [Cyathus striatus]